MGIVYYLDVDNSCIDPEVALLDILGVIEVESPVTLHTSKETLQDFVDHPIIVGRLKEVFGEVVTWPDFEKCSPVDFKLKPDWSKGIFTPYSKGVPTGDIIVLGS